MKINRDELAKMIDNYLETKTIKKIGRRRKKKLKSDGSIITIYMHGEIVKVI